MTRSVRIVDKPAKYVMEMLEQESDSLPRSAVVPPSEHHGRGRTDLNLDVRDVECARRRAAVLVDGERSPYCRLSMGAALPHI